MRSQKSYSLFVLLLLLGATISAQPVEYDMELGKQYSELVEQQMGVYDNSELTAFVRSVGQKLVHELGEQPFSYTFKVADTDVTNAFALPGGYTYVTRGLLALVNNESELAGVMAHEIIHADKRHSVKQMNRGGILPGILRIPGKIVGVFSPALGGLLIAPVDISEAAFKANYSRSHEKDADKEGVLLAANAGYDPNGLTKILERLATEAEIQTGATEKSKLLDDHPVTQKRLKYLGKEIEKIDGDNTAVPGKPVLDFLNGMIYGQNPKQGVIIENKFMHPDMDLFMQYPEDWQTSNTAVMVGAMQNDGEAIIVLTPTWNTMSPRDNCDTIVSKIPSGYVALITENKPVQVNGFVGHSLILDDKAASQTYIHIVWLNVGTNVFQLTAYGLNAHRKSLELSLSSFRNLSEDEKSAIQIRHIEIATALHDESLAELSDRMENVLDLTMTAVMNGIEISSKFEKGQKIKVVTQSPYWSK